MGVGDLAQKREAALRQLRPCWLLDIKQSAALWITGLRENRFASKLRSKRATALHGNYFFKTQPSFSPTPWPLWADCRNAARLPECDTTGLHCFLVHLGAKGGQLPRHSGLSRGLGSKHLEQRLSTKVR